MASSAALADADAVTRRKGPSSRLKVKLTPPRARLCARLLFLGHEIVPNMVREDRGPLVRLLFCIHFADWRSRRLLRATPIVAVVQRQADGIDGEADRNGGKFVARITGGSPRRVRHIARARRAGIRTRDDRDHRAQQQHNKIKKRYPTATPTRRPSY